MSHSASRRLASATSCLTISVAVLLPAVATAHIPMLKGRLVALVAQSDLIVVGVVRQVTPVTGRVVDTSATIDQVFLGTRPESPFTFRGRTAFAPGERYVFLLRHSPAGVECVQGTGTVFPTTAADDAAYRGAIDGIRAALAASDSEHGMRLWAALLPALSANAEPLRYHAALELVALAQGGHPPSARDRVTLQKLRDNPALDPALAPLITTLLQQRPPSTASAVNRSGTPEHATPSR